MNSSPDPTTLPYRKAQEYGVNWWLWRLTLPPLSIPPAHIRAFDTPTLIEAHAVIDALEEAQRRANKEK